MRAAGTLRQERLVRPDRVLDVAEEVLARDIFDVVAARLRADCSWS